MAATITTALDSAKLLETLEKIIREWLVGFLTVGTDVQGIFPYVVQDADAETMEKPWCEYIISIVRTAPTGGGALGTEARFKYPRCEIAFRTKKNDKELSLVLLGDRLDDHFRDATNGRPELGKTGLRQADLMGPIKDNSKNYYLQRWFLDFRVLVQNS